MNEKAHVKTWMGGRCVLVPLNDYFEMQAVLHGFESYDDLRANGLQVVTPHPLYDESGKAIPNQDYLEEGEEDGGMTWQSLS